MSETTLSKQDIDKAHLQGIIEKFQAARVLVVGDIILDEFLLAKPERISREAPVLILEYLQSNYALGGCANAASNIASLGAKVTLIGLVGDDKEANLVEKVAKEQGIDLIPVVDPKRSTTVKTRIISTSNTNVDNGTVLKQQVLRVDRQSRHDAEADLESLIYEKLNGEINKADLVLLSDYSSGVLTDSLAAKAVELCKSKSKKVIVDSTGDFKKFKGADLITPNQPDVEATLKISIKDNEELKKAAATLLNDYGVKEVLITRGAKGMALFAQSEADSNKELNSQIIPAFNVSEVFDVTGAGDTVAAGLSLSMSVGASTLDAAVIGSLAASIVVRKYGTATASQEELLELLKSI